RNVGSTAVDAILASRKEEGPYESLFDLCRRADLKRVNKRTLEGLVYAGGFDGVSGGHHRAELMGAIESAVEQGQSAQRDRASGQNSLFSLLAEPESEFVEAYPKLEEWAPREKLNFERDALGFYLTGHPLDRFQQDIRAHATCSLGDVEAKLNGKEVVLGGVICDLREVQTRSGKGPMAFFQLEDQFGRVEGIVFPKTYKRTSEDSEETFGDRIARLGDEPVFAHGKLEVDTGDGGEISRVKILVEDLREIATVRKEHTRRVLLTLSLEQLTTERIFKLKQIVATFNGPCPMELKVVARDRYASTVVFGDEFGVLPNDNLLLALERLFGGKYARLVG
ncbi:MAG: DNA polymerase III subunit alpha, partial [Nannocystaceae bacterium]